MEVKEHFKEFYEKIRYLGEEIGYDEKTFSRDFYFTVDKHNGLSFIHSAYEETMNDKQVYFKFQGIKMILFYGDWWNLKYGEIELSIERDEEYEGEIASIKIALAKLDEYIECHYKEYLEKINAVIYKDSVQKYKIKYRPRNIFDAKYLKTIHIFNLPITNEDMKSLRKYPNLFRLYTKSCQITGDIGLLNTQVYSDLHSTFQDIRTINACHINSVSFFKSMFEDNKIYPTSNTIKNLSFVGVEMDYTRFLLLTQFKNILCFTVEEYELHSSEIEFLRGLYQVQELSISGEANTLSFVDDLHDLRKFMGMISIKNDETITHLKRKQKDLCERLSEIFEEKEVMSSIIRKHIYETIDRNTFYKKIALSPVAVMKWEDKIFSSKEKEVQSYLEYVHTLPYAKRKEIGTNHQTFLVDTDTSDYYKLLGIATLEDDSFYKTKMINQFGTNLYCEKTSRYGNILPIYGANGKRLEEIEYRKEKDIKVESYYRGHTSTIVKNDNIVFDYYYNRQIPTIDKVEYLFGQIENHPLLIQNSNYIDILKRHKESTLKINELKNKEYVCDPYLCSSISHDYADVSYTIEGETIETFEEIPDPYIDSGYFWNTYSVLKKFRSYDSIKRIVENDFEREHLDLKTRESVRKSIEECISDLNEMDFLYKNMVSYDVLIEQTLPQYQKIYDYLEKQDYLHFYEKDIHTFLKPFHLDSISYDFLFSYVLLKQRIKILGLETELTLLNQKAHVLEEGYGVFSIMSIYEERYDTEHMEDYIDELKEEEKNMIQIYEEITKRIMSIKKTLYSPLKIKREETYKRMIPLMDGLSLDEMKEMKENIPIIAECKGRFSKFVDYLYYYFYKEYPEWISMELLCCPPLPDAYKDEIHAEFVEEHIEHLEGYCKIKK